MSKSIVRLSKLVCCTKTYEEFEREVLKKPRWYLSNGDDNLKRWRKTHLKRFFNLVKGNLDSLWQ